MEIRNIKTGLVWDVDEKHAAKLLKDAELYADEKEYQKAKKAAAKDDKK